MYPMIMRPRGICECDKILTTIPKSLGKGYDTSLIGIFAVMSEVSNPLHPEEILQRSAEWVSVYHQPSTCVCVSVCVCVCVGGGCV